MEGRRRVETDVWEDKETERKVAERQAEATSKDTLSDLEETEAISNAETERQAPAPDGPDKGPRSNLDDSGPI